MLKVECEKCKQWVSLPVYADLGKVECPTCVEAIPVKDVYVSAGQFLICRDILRKSIHKYKRLVEEAEQEVAELEKNGGLRAHSITAGSINGFIKKLKEMLDGCRGQMRHRLGDEYADYTLGRKKCKAKIVNISSSGVCLECREVLGLETLWNDISITFKPRKSLSTLVARGKVMWIGKKGRMGVKFSTDADGWVEGFLRERGERAAVKMR